jgi:hypothetical protein
MLVTNSLAQLLNTTPNFKLSQQLSVEGVNFSIFRFFDFSIFSDSEGLCLKTQRKITALGLTKKKIQFW